MFRITLTFCSGKTLDLHRVDCSIENEPFRTCVRGKTTGAYGAVGTFHWSSGVRATAALFLRAKLSDESTRVEPLLNGGARSLAASLDYAITKQPAWLQDMFGVSATGKTYAKRLFRVTNSHRKRGGPVGISVNPHLCRSNSVCVVLDGKAIEDPSMLRSMIALIEN
jgi:hypothetical protein